MLTIWGRPNSINVQKVLWCAEELGLVTKRVEAGGQFGDRKSTRLNSSHEIPSRMPSSA